MTSGSRLKGRSPLKGTGLLDEFEKDRVKDSVDIVDLIRSYGVDLEQKGGSWMGRCPFHEDKNPSLSVDRSKGLFNCFGCGAGGDVFDFVMQKQGIEFKEALSLLKGNPQTPAVSAKASLRLKSKEAQPPKTPPLDMIDLKSLKDVTDYYCRQQPTHSEAVDYLKERGLYNLELIGRLGIGYAPGDLAQKVSAKQKKELKRLGLFNEKGYESFAGCITFPLYNSSGFPVGLYGRATSGRSKLKHWYLKGPHRGLFNHKAFKVYPERMILTESVIDALSLMVLGLENVSCLYGTNGVTSHLLEALKENRVKEVVLALDSDQPGREAAEKVSLKLLEEGLSVRIIFPPVKDWNRALAAGISKEAIMALIETAELQSKKKVPSGLRLEN